MDNNVFDKRAWPRPIDSQLVTKLLLLQWQKECGLVDYSPLDDERLKWQEIDSSWPDLCAEGGEGVEPRQPADAATGPISQKIINHLGSLEVKKVYIKLLTPWERAALSKMAAIEEWINDKWDMKLMANGRVWRRKLEQKSARLAKWNLERWWEKRSGEKNEELDAMRKDLAKKGIGGPVIVAREKVETKGEEVARLARLESEERPLVSLEVIRVGPNPRILTCRYAHLAQEVRVKLKVKSVAHFKVGMKVEGIREQVGEEWVYEGRLPRAKGRW